MTCPSCGSPIADHEYTCRACSNRLEDFPVRYFYDLSGGMESAAMLVIDQERIRQTRAIVRWADTGKQFPEMAASLDQIGGILNLEIVRIPPRLTFDQYLFERGGMVRKGTNDCSRRMKRANLMRHLKTFEPPYEVNLGFNAGEQERADAFSERNERDWIHWRYPLIETNISREETWEICAKAGFTILVGMYKKMGRFDCFWCGNQTRNQARRVMEFYPELFAEWKAAEAKKGHHFMRIPLSMVEAPTLFDNCEQSTGCSCFGGNESIVDETDGEDTQ